MPVSNAKKVAAAARERAKQRRDEARRALKKAAASKEKGKKEDAAAWSKAKVKKEEGEQVQAARVWKCKKNDGKRWHCHRTVSQPNTLCSYHFVQKRSYLNPDYEFPGVVEPEEPARPVRAAASKPSGNSKPRRKKPTSDFNATEGFYYYAGFGPFRSKRHCRSGGGTNEPAPAVKQEVEPVKQEEEEEEQVPEHASPPAADQLARAAEDANRDAAPHNDVSTCDDDIAGIAGVDEDTSDDYDGIGIASSSVDGDPRASNGGGKRKTPWKRWKRKPVKARSLKSLM